MDIFQRWPFSNRRFMCRTTKGSRKNGVKWRKVWQVYPIILRSCPVGTTANVCRSELSPFEVRSIFVWRRSYPEVLKQLQQTTIYNIYVLFFRENKAWNFMWIVCLANDLQEVLSLIFSKNNKLNIRMPSATNLLKALRTNIWHLFLHLYCCSFW